MNWLRQQAANIAGTTEPYHGPSAIQSVARQAETTPYSDVTKDDLKWAVMDSTNVETQTFYIMADSGHIAMVQIIYSNVMGVRTTSQFNCKVIYPDGKTPHLWSSDGLEHFGFSADRLGFFADNVAFDVSEDGTSYSLKSAVNTNSVVNLKVTKASPGFQVGKNGTTYYGTDPAEPWGRMRHVFWPRCTTTGSIITKDGEIDFTGRGLYSFALQGMKPHHAAASWNFVNFQTPTYSAIMMEFKTPHAYAETVVNVGGIAIDGEILFAGSSNSLKHTETRDDPDWPEPGAIDFKWTGKNKDGKEVTATLVAPLGERTDKIDVMAEVPGFVKNIVGGVVGTRPFIYQYTPKDLELKVKVEGEDEKVEKGKYFGEATFISS